MFDFTSLQSVHLEITNRCQASCPMCARNIHGGIEKPLELTDWTLADFQQIFNQEVLMQLRDVVFCGEYGEATINNDLISMCQYAQDVNPNISVSIQTNGSTRNEAWWTRLAEALPTNHTVVFALDGLEDTHHLYRQGTSFNKIIKNATAFIQAGGNAEWQFICFKHNEHQVEEARAISKSLGFKDFILMYSNRFTDNFPVVDRNGTVTHIIKQPIRHSVKPVTIMHLDDYKTLQAGNITCKSDKAKDIIIDANFKLIPCCMLAYFLSSNADVEIELYKKYGLEEHTSMMEVVKRFEKQVFELIDKWGGFDALDAKKHSIKSILNSPAWQTMLPNEWEAKSNLTQPCLVACSDASPYYNNPETK